MDKPRTKPVPEPMRDPDFEIPASEIFWEMHWKKFVWGLVVLVVAILAVGAWQLYNASQRHAAEALLSTASTIPQWEEVETRYPRTIAAGNASLLIAAALRDEGKTDQAAARLEAFTGSHPDHPLIGAAWFALAEIFQLQGQKDRALETYRIVSARYTTSYTAPLALLAEGRLLAAQGKSSEARSILESISTQYPDTPAAMVAAGELARLPAPAAAQP